MGEKIGQEVDGGNEVASGGEHDEVDGVEVLFAAEAPAEIGLGMTPSFRRVAPARFR